MTDLSLRLKFEELKKLYQYKNYLNQLADSMPSTASSLSNKLNQTKQYRFILSILLGTELIKEELRGLITFEDYIFQLKEIIKHKQSYVISPIKIYNRNSYGVMMDLFFKLYGVEKNYPELYKKMKELNEKRNSIAHESIFTFNGDIDEADEMIRPYIVKQTLNEILNELIVIFNKRQPENDELGKQMKTLGLIKS